MSRFTAWVHKVMTPFRDIPPGPSGSPWENRVNSREGNFPDDYFRPLNKRFPMYELCFKSCLASVAIATALGVAAIWVPEGWHEVGAKLLWTDLVLFAGSLAGACLSYAGMDHE